MLFCKFVLDLCWCVVRNIFLAPISVFVDAWAESYGHYSFTKRMRRQSAAQKRPQCNRPVLFVQNDGSVSTAEPRDGKKRHRRGHRGGRKHKKHFHHGGGHRS